MATNEVGADRSITLPETIREWLPAGTKFGVRLVKGRRAMLSRFQPDAPSEDKDVVTVSNSGAFVLPHSIQQALEIKPGDRIEFSTATGAGFALKVFISKHVEQPIEALKTAPTEMLNTHTLPHYAERPAQRRTWRPSREIGSDRFQRYDAEIESLPRSGESSEVWKNWAASSGGLRGEGGSIPEALEALSGKLQDELTDLYFRTDMDPAPKATLRPMFPREVEETLERLRDRWFSVEAAEREQIAIRPAAIELAHLGLAPADIAWMLELSPELIEAYQSGRPP